MNLNNTYFRSIVRDKEELLSKDLIESAKSIISSTELKEVLEKNCQMCINNEFYTKPFDEIYNKQQSTINKYIAEIKERNSNMTDELKIDTNSINK